MKAIPPKKPKTKSKIRYASRLPFVILAGLALLAALWAGLLRLGWQLPALPLAFASQHGALMVSGFLGTVISLERAVALSHRFGKGRIYFLTPLLAGLGALALLLGLPSGLGRGAIALASTGLSLIFLLIYRLQPDTANATMGLGALLWLVGNVLWLANAPVYRVVPWWAGFLVLTIAGERLELARVLSWGRQAQFFFIITTGLYTGGLLLSLLFFDIGLRISGIGLIALGLWLLRFDIARRTIRQEGLTRFIAACLLPGYVWLMVSGLLWLLFGGRYTAGAPYDAILHTLFLGFVFSMIFGHAPIIIPSVLGISVPFHPVFYAHLAFLHLSLLLRIGGDLSLNLPLRMWGGFLNVVALLLFLGSTVYVAASETNKATGLGE